MGTVINNEKSQRPQFAFCLDLLYCRFCKGRHCTVHSWDLGYLSTWSRDSKTLVEISISTEPEVFSLRACGQTEWQRSWSFYITRKKKGGEPTARRTHAGDTPWFCTPDLEEYFVPAPPIPDYGSFRNPPPNLYQSQSQPLRCSRSLLHSDSLGGAGVVQDSLEKVMFFKNKILEAE